MSNFKIYFCGSIRAGRDDFKLYHMLIDRLKSYGEVLTEHVGNAVPDENIPKMKNMQERDKYIYDQDMEWLKQSDVVVAECTQVSMGVGFEIGRAVSLGKPILCLFRPDDATRQISAMINGAVDSDKLFFLQNYSNENETESILKDFFSKVKK